MARLNLLICLVLGYLAVTECRVIYKKFTKNVPSKKNDVKEMEEIYEVFHTYRRPPMYGHSERFINDFLATDYDPQVLQHPQKPNRTTKVPTTTEEATTEAAWETQASWTTEKSSKLVSLTTIKPNPYENVNPNGNLVPWQPQTTIKAVHPELEIVAVDPEGGEGAIDLFPTEKWWPEPTTTEDLFPTPKWLPEPTTTEDLFPTEKWWSEPTTTEKASTTIGIKPVEKEREEEEKEDTDDSEYHYADKEEVEEKEEDEYTDNGDEESYKDGEDYEDDQPSTTQSSWWG